MLGLKRIGIALNIKLVYDIQNCCVCHTSILLNVIVDPMHNLLLGTAKNMLAIWKNSRLLSNTMFDQIQHEVDSINLPAGIGWVPGKIAAFFSTAEQCKTWTIILSRHILENKLPLEHFQVWCLFAEACSLMCHPVLHNIAC